MDSLQQNGHNNQLFDVILADVPWPFETYSDKGKGRSAENHYSVMSVDDICALPVARLIPDNCALFFWAVWPRIFDAQKVIEAWGFTFRALAWEWVKLNQSGMGLRMGMGYYTRANVEPLLLAVKGSMPVCDKGILNVLMSPIRQHSRKPEEQYDRIESLYPNRRYLELFARRPRAGWTSLGNAIDGRDIRDSLGEMIRPLEVAA